MTEPMDEDTSSGSEQVYTPESELASEELVPPTREEHGREGEDARFKSRKVRGAISVNLPRFPPLSESFKPRPRANKASKTGDEDDTETGHGPVGHANIVMSFSQLAQTPPRRYSVSDETRSGAHVGTLRLLGDRGASPESATADADFTLANHPEDITMTDVLEDTVPQGAEFRAREDSASSAGSDVEILGDLPTARQSSDTSHEPWHQDWLDKQQMGIELDLFSYPYKGWRIDSPTTQLLRAKNFLADGDTDRIIDWPRKFAELAEYFSYLLHNYNGEAWGKDLKEAVDMLHTHWVFEQYHYGRPKLTLDFPDVWPEHSKRLPPLPGPNITLGIRDPSDAETMGERKLLYTEVAKAHDVQYEMPQDVLEKHYLTKHRLDLQQYWRGANTAGTDLVHEGDEGSSMVHAENSEYESCLRGGLDATANALIGDASFTFSPKDIITKSDGTQEASAESLLSFARFRGARRAALELCLKTFDNSENKTALTPWRALVLPLPRLPDQPDAGVIFDCKHVAKVPEKEARDPFAYTLGHKWYAEAQRYWADWARPHAVKGTYGHARWLEREEPPMNLPTNYSGPYTDNGMDKEMQKTYDSLRRYQKLHQRLKRAARWAPRKLMDKVLTYIESGLNGEDGMFLKFRNAEFVDEDKRKGLHHLRPREEEWLHFLGGECVNEKMLKAMLPHDPVSLLFVNRLRQALADINPEALFQDSKPVALKELLALNPPGSAGNNFYAFTEEDIRREIQLCEEMGLIKLGHEDGRSSEETVMRPDVDMYPEDRVRWLSSDFDPEPPKAGQVPAQDPSGDDDGDDDAASVVSADSSVLSVPDSEAALGPYTIGMPRQENLRSWDDVLNDRPGVQRVQSKSAMFFQCLAYRLGKSLRELLARHKASQAQLTPEQREKNTEFVKDVGEFWIDDALKRPNDRTKNPQQGVDHGDSDRRQHRAIGSDDPDRVTPLYRDVIKIADPEAYQRVVEEWGPRSLGEDHREGSDKHVRKEILREAYENKSLLYPTRYTKFTGKDGKTEDIPRREPVWSFGHPACRGFAPRFWDINRWPLHLQTTETQEAIRETGPDRLPPKPEVVEIEVRHFGRSADGQRRVNDNAKEIRKPYGPNRRFFESGPAEFWVGDTPLQRKTVEDSWRAGIETTRRRKKGWSERIKGLFWAEEPSTPTTPELPYVRPRDVPASRPREPEEDDGDRDEEMAEAPSPGPPLVQLQRPPTGFAYGEDMDTPLRDPADWDDFVTAQPPGSRPSNMWAKKEHGGYSRERSLDLEMIELPELRAAPEEVEDLYFDFL